MQGPFSNLSSTKENKTKDTYQEIPNCQAYFALVYHVLSFLFCLRYSVCFINLFFLNIVEHPQRLQSTGKEIKETIVYYRDGSVKAITGSWPVHFTSSELSVKHFEHSPFSTFSEDYCSMVFYEQRKDPFNS